MKKKDKKRNKKKIALIMITSILAVFFLLIMPGMSVMVYNDNFGERFETPDWTAWSVSDFDGLEVNECTFPSNDGQLLAGYQYKKENQKIKGVVVLAHGLGGGGHNTYMDIADYFTSNGYLVFAYDATGNDKSEGDSVRGLPQGVIDLDFALRYVKDEEEYRDLPVVLFGHSWGAYSAGSVLNCHTDVKASVLVAGFDRSTGLFEQQGRSMIGNGIQLFMPYVSLYERLKFGGYAAYSVTDGCAAASEAGIMVICSSDDTTVLPENGYDIFYEKYGDSSRFTFIEYGDRGHDYVYCSEASQNYRKQLDKDYDAWKEEHSGQNAELKAEFMKKYLDKSKYYELDEKLMQQMLDFYDSNINR